MKIALLGFGTVGKAVYQILIEKSLSFFKQYNIQVKYILVRNKKNKAVDERLLTTNYKKILKDPEVEVVVEMMGASVSYDYMKQALSMSKHVITANKEVIANHYIELQQIALEHHVNLLFEASVGGGIPIVHTLLTSTQYNRITSIEGILNGTTNFILSMMHQDKIELSMALKMAQEKGFAEADPTADLEGLDMVRKIAILSMIAYQSPIDMSQIDHFGIGLVTKEIIEILDLLDYKLKFMASSKKTTAGINLCVEPVVVKKSDLFANVNYEYNLVRYCGDYCGNQMMYGKGAGSVTANAILFDLELLLNEYQQTFMPKKEAIYLHDEDIYHHYLIKAKETFNPKWIGKKRGALILTKKISKQQLKEMLNDIEFYARVVE